MQRKSANFTEVEHSEVHGRKDHQIFLAHRKSFSKGAFAIVRRVKHSHPVPKAGKTAGKMMGLGGGLQLHARKTRIAEWARNRRTERGNKAKPSPSRAVRVPVARG